jgi:hypothetical protein
MLSICQAVISSVKRCVEELRQIAVSTARTTATSQFCYRASFNTSAPSYRIYKTIELLHKFLPDIESNQGISVSVQTHLQYLCQLNTAPHVCVCGYKIYPKPIN